MKVRCTGNMGVSIPIPQRIPPENEETRFAQLQIGRSYFVYGLMSGRYGVRAMVCPDSNGPVWAPMSLFEIIDSGISGLTHFKNIATESGFEWLRDEAVSIIGYKDLIRPEHFIGILERDLSELEIFYIVRLEIKRVAEIQEHWSGLDIIY